MGTWAGLEEGCVIFLTFDVPLVKFDWLGRGVGDILPRIRMMDTPVLSNVIYT